MLTLHIFCQLTSWPGIFPTTTSFLPPHTDGQLSVKAGGSGAGLAAALVPSEWWAGHAPLAAGAQKGRLSSSINGPAALASPGSLL